MGLYRYSYVREDKVAENVHKDAQIEAYRRAIVATSVKLERALQTNRNWPYIVTFTEHHDTGFGNSVWHRRRQRRYKDVKRAHRACGKYKLRPGNSSVQLFAWDEEKEVWNQIFGDTK